MRLAVLIFAAILAIKCAPKEKTLDPRPLSAPSSIPSPTPTPEPTPTDCEIKVSKLSDDVEWYRSKWIDSCECPDE